MATKTIAVIGVTGNQGGSVADTFVKLPEYKVRGTTRDPSKASAQPWKDKGVELVAVELDDVETLKKAFTGANVIFANTDFWANYHNPSAKTEAEKRGITQNEVAFEREVQQGKNIIDAANANISSISHFILSTLAGSRYYSKGKIDFNLHFDAKWEAVEYLKATYPDLWAKTSLLEVGMYNTNWKQGMGVPQKGEDGVYTLSLALDPDSQIPFVDTVADTGNYVKGLLELPYQTIFVGAGTKTTFRDWLDIWGRHNKVKTAIQTLPKDTMQNMMGDLGREFQAMFDFIDELGYDGGDPNVIYPWDAKSKYGVDIPVTTLEQYIQNEDWSGVV